MVCIEVIEHLPSLADATQAAVNVLTILQPKLACFTTPNYEANRIIKAICNPETSAEESILKETAENEVNFCRNDKYFYEYSK